MVQCSVSVMLKDACDTLLNYIETELEKNLCVCLVGSQSVVQYRNSLIVDDLRPVVQ